jgi:hypothetical protein
MSTITSYARLGELPGFSSVEDNGLQFIYLVGVEARPMSIFRTIICLVALFPLILLAGCTTTYKEATISGPHAILRPAQGDYLFVPTSDPHVGIVEIDGLPINRLTRGYGADRIVTPGTHSIRVWLRDRNPEVAIADFEIHTFEGNIYVLGYQEESETITYTIREEPSGHIVSQIESVREPLPDKYKTYGGIVTFCCGW